MQSTSKKILTTLSERGYRITQSRQEISKMLSSSKKPLTIQEIVERTDSDEASVYRFIHMLKKEKLIEDIPVRNNVSRYTLAIGDHHHHHIICTTCGLVAHVSCDTKLNIPKSIQEFSKIDDHEVTFYGVCQKCV